MKMALDTTAVPSGGLRAKTGLRHKLHSFFVYVKHHPMLYLMLIPGLFFLFIYKLAPLYGILIAFKDYNIFLGSNPIDAIGLSDWVGLEHFRRLFASSQFTKVLANTLIINGLKILWLFPIPIICAILLNEIRRATYRKFAQTAIYMPYFFSWVVIFGIFYSLFSSYGIINTAITAMGGTRIGFFTDNSVFRSVLVFTEGWKEVGYNTVIYLAAITGIDITLYEAARVDGASKWRQIWNITMPGLLPTIVLMLILKVGYILETGFEQVLVFYNPAVYEVADIIQTYVYRLGIGRLPHFSRGRPEDLLLFVSALRADAVFIQRDAAQRAAVNFIFRVKFRAGSVYAAGKSELRNVQLILQQVINDLDHALNGHGLLSDDQTAVRICGGMLCLKRLALHNVVGMSVFDALFLVYVKDRRQQGVILPQDQRVVKVFQNVPCGFLNFIAGEHHVHAGIHAVLHFNGQNTRMAVQVLGFALEPIKAVCILQV